MCFLKDEILLTSTSISFTSNQGWHLPATATDSLSSWNTPKTLAVLFGPCQLFENNSCIAELRLQLPNVIVIGASSIGVIAGPELFDDALVARLIRFETTELVQVSGTVHNIDHSFQEGARLCAQLVQKQGLKGIFVLADGLTINGTELLKGMMSVAPDVAISGGMAGDGTAFARTSVLSDEEPAPKRVVAIGFYGDAIRFSRGCFSGTTGFGPMRRVTKSIGNEVFEVDGQPILELYKKYLGDQAASLPGSAAFFPLSLQRSAEGGMPLVRSVLAVNQETNSITVAGDMPVGSYTQLMRTSHAQLLDGAQKAISQALASSPKSPDSFVLTVSCFGRRVLLGERTGDEIDVFTDALAEGTGHLGFFSYGEISAFPGQACDFHNMTLATTALVEV
jgi:hypothetical protein